MLIGIGIIFLTFLTDNNALEIAISGMASVFIGIAVNNYSTFDARETDGKRHKLKIQRSLKMMEITINKVRRINVDAETDAGGYLTIKNELVELEQCINLSIELIKEAELSE